jgi:hypothetical protein
MGKTKSKRQKGGGWFGLPDFSSWGKKAENSLSSMTSSLGLGSTPASSSSYIAPSNAPSNASSYIAPSNAPPSSYTAAPTQNESVNSAYPIGGSHKRTRTNRKRMNVQKMNGGKGGLGLVYYASPVTGMSVAEPTYMIPYNNVKIGGKNKSKRRGGSKSRSNKSRSNKSRSKS